MLIDSLHEVSIYQSSYLAFLTSTSSNHHQNLPSITQTTISMCDHKSTDTFEMNGSETKRPDDDTGIRKGMHFDCLTLARLRLS